MIPHEMANKRLMTSLPPKTYALLEQWAKKDGLTLSAMAAFVLKTATDTEEREGRLRIDAEEN